MFYPLSKSYVFTLSFVLFALGFSDLSQAQLNLTMRPDAYAGQWENSYKYQLIKLILDSTLDTHGPYTLHKSVKTDSQKRDIHLLNEGKISIFISMTSSERENAMLAIRIPVFKGLYGYRVLLIRDDEQAKFSSIENIDQLKSLTGVQGAHWPDLTILKYNGFNVESSSNHESQFRMLDKGRIDYFPRGLHEPWKELQSRPDLNLTVEKDLLLYYPAPGYIFVQKNNLALANRIKKGFDHIIASGEFDQLFNQHPQIREVKKQASLESRTLFNLENPLLSPFTPLDQAELWFKHEQISKQ